MRTKNRRSNFALLFFLFLALSVKSQEIENAIVSLILPIGNQDYCIIVDESTNIRYKSSPYNKGELTLSQNVSLSVIENQTNTFEVSSPTLTNRLYATSDLTPADDEFLFPTNNLPQIVNEILFFDNESAAAAYYESIDKLINENQSEESGLEERLDIIESHFTGFISYRSFLNYKYKITEGNLSEIDIDKMGNEDFVKDDIQKTLLNKDRLIGIGDFIYYFHAPNVKIKIDKLNKFALSVLKDLEDDTDVLDPNSIFFDTLNFQVIAHHVRTMKNLRGEVIVNNTKYTTTPQIQNVSCSVYKKMVRISREKCTFTDQTWHCSTYWSQDGDELTIDWNDGTIEYIDQYWGQWIEHTYTSPGTYHPTTITSFQGGLYEVNDGIGTNGTAMTILVETACTQEEDGIYYSYTTGNLKMTASLWVSDNFFGNHIGSYTHAWKKKANGSWDRTKAEIYTSVDGTFRNENCIIQDTKSGSKHHNNDKKIQEKKHKLFKHFDIANGDIKSYHYMIKNGVTITKELVLNPC
jgi:hypothetical protein